jgi:alkylation response protein AidB-like acyl-CoA dehydrogenase
MELIHTDEQEQLRSSLRKFFEDKSPTSEVRRLMAEGTYDKTVWKQMADQLGLQGLAIPEEHGGSGYTFVELAIVMEEQGRALLVAPYFATVALAAQAVLDLDDADAAAALLPGIAEGTTTATLAITEQSGSWDLDSISLEARPADGGYTLHGVKSYVIDGAIVDQLVVAAKAPGGLSLFLVAGDAAGVTRVNEPPLDQTRGLATITFDGAQATLLGAEGAAAASLPTTMNKAIIALAAEQLGGARRALEMAVEYTKIREAFGRTIASFQATKHKAANMFTKVETTAVSVHYGSWAAADNSDDLAVVASMLKAWASEAYFFCAANNIQMHGGIGFTWEHDAHLFLKRAKASQLIFGDDAYHFEQLAERLGV